MIESNAVKISSSTRIIYAFIIVLLIFFKPEYKTELRQGEILVYVSIFLVAVLIHFISNRDINWFRTEVFFLLGFAIVHFQWPIMYSFSDILPANASRTWVDSRYVAYGTWLSSLGGVSWLLGYSLLSSRKRNSDRKFVLNYSYLLWFSIILFILFLITAGSNFLTGGVYRGEGGQSSGDGLSGYIQLLFSIVILILTAFVVLKANDIHKVGLLKGFPILDKKYTLLVLVYVIIFLSIGDRGGAIQVIIALLIMIGTFIRPFKLGELGIMVVVGATIMTLIGLGRSMETNKSILGAGLENANISSAYDLTIELANSNRTLYMALSAVPESHDFFYGKLWVGNLLSPVPFAQALYLQVSDTKPYELGSAGYITYLTYGEKSTSGEGTSLIADIYMNFGTIGVAFFMLIFGIFFKIVDNKSRSQSKVIWIVIAAMLAGSSFYFGRSELLGTFRAVIWSLPIVYFFTNKKKKNL